MLGVGVSSNATAACRTFHYDHDGNPYTPLKFRVACEKTYAVRTIPKYRIETQDVASGTTRPRDPRHIKLPRPKPQCIILSVYRCIYNDADSLAMRDNKVDSHYLNIGGCRDHRV